MRGRKPKPGALHDLHGNPGKRTRPPEPEAPGLLHEPPEWLSEDAKESWRYAMAHAPRNVLRRIDRGLLVGWCVAESLHREATMKQEQAGSLVYKPKGSEVFIQSPWLAIINKQFQLMLKAASELGFSPVSRPRLTRGGDSPDPLPNPRNPDGTSQGVPGLRAFIASNPNAPQVH